MYKVGDYNLHGRVKCSKNIFGNSPYNQIPVVMLCLLLKGGFSIEKISISKKTEQNIDYTILGTSPCIPRQLSNYILQITIPHPRQKLYDNFPFYKTILIEFCACLHAEKDRLGIISMLHLYRILERMSYALPLLYAKKSDDYCHTYDTIKSFFGSSGPKVGELGFFKQSLGTILDSTEKSFLFQFELDSSEKHALRFCFNGFDSRIFSQNGNLVNFELSIFDTIRLLINARNSFFHALSGKHYISLEELIEPDKAFHKLTHNFINALGFLISKVAEPALIP